MTHLLILVALLAGCNAPTEDRTADHPDEPQVRRAEPQRLSEVVVELGLELMDPEAEFVHLDASKKIHADIYMDGDLVGSVKCDDYTKFKASVGSHQIELQAEGYQSMAKTLRVLPDSKQELHFHLKKL